MKMTKSILAAVATGIVIPFAANAAGTTFYICQTPDNDILGCSSIDGTATATATAFPRGWSATDGGNEPIDAHDPFWPILVYDGKTYELKNPMRFRDGIAVVRTAPGRFRISGGLNRKGNVGDVAVWSVRESRKVANECFVTLRTKNCRFEGVTFYATPHGRIIEAFCTSNSYVNCRMVRRPPAEDVRPRGMPRLRSGNHDFIIAKCGSVGPQIIGCTAEYHCDDCVNISGMYCLVTEVKGRELRVLKD